MKRRNLEEKDIEVYINFKRISTAQLKKELPRYSKHIRQAQLEFGQHKCTHLLVVYLFISLFIIEPSPEPPDNVEIHYPSRDNEPQNMTVSNLPWLDFNREVEAHCLYSCAYFSRRY